MLQTSGMTRRACSCSMANTQGGSLVPRNARIPAPSQRSRCTTPRVVRRAAAAQTRSPAELSFDSGELERTLTDVQRRAAAVDDDDVQASVSGRGTTTSDTAVMQADGLAGSSMLEELSTPSRVGAGLVAMALLWWAAGGSPGEVLTLEEEALHAYVRTPQGSFAVGCVASFFAEMLTCPLDTIKVRMQLTCNMPGEAAVGVWGMGRNIVTREGVGQLWKGAGTASFRQMIYGGTRLTIYGPLKQVLASALPVPPGVVNFLSGMSAGILGTLVVNPLDVRKVRMQQGKSGNVVHIVREGGAAALYKGLAANVTRGATVTAVEFSLFDQLKLVIGQQAAWHPDLSPVALTAISAMLAGLATTCFVSPADVVKARAMTARAKAASVPSWGILREIVTTEGPLGLYAGFAPSAARISLFAVVLFSVREAIRQI